MISTPQTWIEISKKALLHNLKMYKQTVTTGQLGVAVKSNAYGHGIIPVAQICQESEHTQWLCVATLSEALLLRANNITKKILVMYFLDSNPAYALSESISLMVCDKQTLDELNKIGISNNKAFKIHIKIDSGMSRFGFDPKEAITIIKQAIRMPGIIIEGIYSHLAQAANPDQTFNKEQEQVFLKVLNALEEEKIIISYKHLANSAGSISLSTTPTNLIRLGLGAYGWWPSQANQEVALNAFPNFQLKPVLTFKTRIAHIKELEANRFVGYDRTYKTTQPTRVAILPVGYYDGYDRRLSSKGILLIRGQYAPVIGIIAMTTTLVDITHIPDAHVNDEVILMGDYEKITPTQLANVIGSFNAREIMTRLNPLIPRIVVN